MLPVSDWRALAGAWDIKGEEFWQMTMAEVMRVVDLKEERHHREMKYKAFWSLMIASSMAETSLTVDDLYPRGKDVKW